MAWVKGMMGRDSLGSGEGSLQSQIENAKVPMMVPQGSALPRSHAKDAGMRRRCPQGYDPSVIHGGGGSQKGPERLSRCSDWMLLMILESG